jgi:hypothetical protein
VNKRDKAILDDLQRFRVMDRDSIAELHFKGLKNPADSCNHTLLRLIRENHIERSTAFVPYVYFSSEINIKKNSQKTGHFLAILNTYKEMLQHGSFTMFLVEPKYGPKGMAEPDIFCIYRDTPFFIEVQNSYFNEKQINDKLDRYEELYNSGVIDNEPWQLNSKKVFPNVLIISEQRYAIEKSYPFRIMQAPTFNDLLQSLKPKTEQKHLPQDKTIQNHTPTNIKLKIN